MSTSDLKKDDSLELKEINYGETDSNANSYTQTDVKESSPSLFWRLLKKLEIDDTENLKTSQLFLYNKDLKPVEAKRRTWRWWNYVFFWFADAFNINTFQIAATGITAGLSWWVVWITVWIGYGITGIFVVLASRIGSFYHVSFPISCRSSFGVYGSLWPVINRVVMACVWYGVQASIAGETVQLMLKAIFGTDLDERIHNTIPGGNITSFGLLSFFIFWFCSLPAIYLHPHQVRHLFTIKAFICPAAAIGFLVWTIKRADGIGSIVHQGSTISGSTFGWAFVNSVMNCIANFATLIVNAPDFSRFGTKSSSAWMSQMISIPMAFGITCLFGVLITSASTVLFDETFWDPLDILSGFLEQSYDSPGTRAGVFLISFGFAVAQLGTNISANSLSAGTDMSALLPKFMNIRRGGFLCAIIGFAICPWNLLSSSSMFTTYLSAYAVFLSAIAGVVFSDYFLVRRGFIVLDDLYTNEKHSTYSYGRLGINWRAYVAYFCGIAPNITGFVGATETHVVPDAATKIYYLAFFVGYAVSAGIYFLLCWLFPPEGIPDELTSLTSKGWYELYADVEDFDYRYHAKYDQDV